MNMLNFLMENDVVILSQDTDRKMTADEMNELGGEFVVYKNTGRGDVDLYRGDNFEIAMKVLLSQEAVK